MRREHIYLPGLNGLRAISAIGVLGSHITASLIDFGLKPQILGRYADGNIKGWYLSTYGVTIFFTLSGFLITFLLLKEKENGAINIKNFYIRRILRIWPLYYLYIVICILTLYFFNIPFRKESLIFYVLLSANVARVLNIGIPYVYQYWSLGVEEQFYLFFPQLAKKSNKKLLRLSIVLIIIMMSLKLVFWFIRDKYGNGMPLDVIGLFGYHVMLIGVIGAILYYSANKSFINFATHKVTQLISWLFLFLIIINKYHIISLLDNEIISVTTVFLIIGQVTKRNNIINLENKVCDFFGKISYSIYVIHPIIIFYYSKFIGHYKSDSVLNYITVYVVITITTILFAYISYEFYEKQFLRLKAKYTTVKSSSSRNGVELSINVK